MITREIACDNIELFAKEGRLVQSAWHAIAKDGRELACLLGAIDPSISSSQMCPAEVMPPWMAELLILLFDGVRKEKALEYGIRFAVALRTGKTDESVLRRFLIATVEAAVLSATPKGIIPSYWLAIKSACDDTCEAIRLNIPEKNKEARAAARAAAYAAADAAANAAYAAAYAAANAAYAVDAAARAANAADAARVADAADAARVAANAAAYAVDAAARAANAARVADAAAQYEVLFDALINVMTS